MLKEILTNPVFFYSIVFLTSALSASVGTGGGAVLLPLAALQFGVKESVGILTIYFLFQNLNKLVVFRKHVQWQIGFRVIAWALPFALLGALALWVIPVEIFKKVLAIVVLAYVVIDVLKLIPQKRQPEAVLPLFSIGYGFLSGLIGSGNVVKGPLFISLSMRKETYIATYAFTSLFMNVPKIISYSATGIIDRVSVIQSIPFLIISIVAMQVGRMFLRHVRDDMFSYAITASVALSAIALLVE